MTVSITARKNFARAWQRAKFARLHGPVVFAQALLARHGRGINRVPRFTLLLALRPMPPQLALHRNLTNITNSFAVNLQTVLHRREAAPERLTQLDATRQLPAMTLPSGITAPAPAATMGPTPPAVASVLRRILGRATRTEAKPSAMDGVLRAMPVPAGTAPGLIQAPSAGAAGDFPMLRPRSNSPAAIADEDSATSDVTSTLHRATLAAPDKPLPAHEIERITEQVLRSIDRHIIAERERRGRF